VVWRDVKPENFLFANEDDDSPLKAVDFGTAERCKLGEFITARAGSLKLHHRSCNANSCQVVKLTPLLGYDPAQGLRFLWPQRYFGKSTITGMPPTPAACAR
jgi:serine/threonine protein kinase